MSQIKFQKLINEFSPASLLEVLRGHDFFLVQQNQLPAYDSKLFKNFEQLGLFGPEQMEDRTNVVVICANVQSPLNERSSRKNQYDIAKKILKDSPRYNAGIFVFYDNKGDFRMSLIYAEYLGTKVQFNTFRRFTYFVSKDQSNTTFLQQLGNFNFVNLSQLKDLFSVDKVTKEFFKKYRDLFIETLEDFEQNNEFQDIVVKTNISTTADFVKKLMGQIVFLYFVQKKGWLGVRKGNNWGSGDQAFLRTLYTSCIKSDKNYFNDYLEPLFYQALAEKNENDYFELFNCKVPFLNGGLFESVYDWQSTKINIPNATIAELLDLFDQYNFTVDENTPADQEISVDPEMLGKIFENLLDVKDRKDKGAFYTPREIVHYMCKESLIQHLVSDNTAPEERVRKIFQIKDTDFLVLVDSERKAEVIKKLPDLNEIAERIDQSLRNIKVVDPAVGSGAFPMGLLNEISSVRYFLNTNFIHKTNKAGNELSLYDIKKETLENCIYAVDLEPGAVEIAKLRFWLALIVEYESSDSNIAPPTLPNLDYKIMQGNSLLEEYEGVKLFDEKLLQSPIINAEILNPKNQEMIELQGELMRFFVQNPDLAQKRMRSEKPKEIIELETRLRDLLKQGKKIESDSVSQSDLFTSVAESKMIWDEIKHKHKLFFSESEKDKKRNLRKQIDDLSWQLIEATLTEQKNDSALKKLEQLKESNTKPFFLWHLYFAEVFEEKGGFDIVIGNPPYVNIRKVDKDTKQAYQKHYSSASGQYDLYVLFIEKSLSLLKKNGYVSLITPNKFLISSYGKNIRKIIAEKTILKDFVDHSKDNTFEGVGVYPVVFILKNEPHEVEISNDYNLLKVFNFDKENSILEKLDRVSKKLIDYCFIKEAIHTGNVRQKLIANEKVNSNYFPLLRGKDCDRYSISWQGLYINYDYSIQKNIGEYASLIDKTYFLNEKIFLREIALRPTATYDNEGYFCLNKAYVVGQKDKNVNIKYVLGLLNSKLVAYFFEKKFGDLRVGGGYLQFKKQFTSKIPIIVPANSFYEKIIELVNEILTSKKANPAANTQQIENKIDQIVYLLFDLTPEEIAIVEAH